METSLADLGRGARRRARALACVAPSQAPGWLKLGTLGIVLYLFSPVDLIPDVVPLFGVLDDLVVVPFAIRWLIKRLPAPLRAEAEQRAGRTMVNGSR